MRNSWVCKCSIIAAVTIMLGVFGGTTAWADDGGSPQVNRARRWLESSGAESDILAFLHTTGVLRRVDCVSIEMHDDGGFRIWYNYYWKSPLSDDADRTQIAVDIADNGLVNNLFVTDDTSWFPAFVGTAAVVEVFKQVLLRDDAVRKHPEWQQMIEDASARQLLILDLRLRRIF